jgi:hypothetical protein
MLANKYHHSSAMVSVSYAGSVRGKDSDRAAEWVRASSLAGKGVDTSSRLFAVVNAGKVRLLVLVRPCCSSSCVGVG